MHTESAITPLELQQRLGEFPPPTVVDVRRSAAFEREPEVIAGAIRRIPEDVANWAGDLERWRSVVVYCVHGHEVSQEAMAALRRAGFDAAHLVGGLHAWREHAGAIVPHAPPSRWVTRARPKIDRIACPWLVRRLIDPSAEFYYVPGADVAAFAAANGATPYDVPGVAYTHDGPHCSFDAFIRLHALTDPALADLAVIVRAADTGTLPLAAQAPGLLAVSLGLSTMFADDHAMLRAGMLVYDALYAWCRQARTATHDPARTPVQIAMKT